MSPHRNKITLFASLSLLLVGFLVLLNSERKLGEKAKEYNRSVGAKSNQTQKTTSQSEPTSPSRASHSSDKDFVIIEPVSQMRRGSNRRLLLEEAVAQKRDTNAEKVSQEVVFARLSSDQWGPLTFDEQTLAAIEVSFDQEALSNFLDSKAETIAIPLSIDREVEIIVDQVVTRGKNTITLIGKVADESLSDVLVVFHDGALSGSLAFHETNTHYQVGMAGNGNIAIRQLDPSKVQDSCLNCQNPEHFMAELADDILVDEPEDENAEGEILAAPAGTTPFDIVVGYSAQARQSSGGTAAMEAKIIEAVDRLNLAFTNSAAGDWFCSLLATAEDSNPNFSDSDYETMGAMLTDLRQTTDGILDSIADLKEELGADQATFICNAAISGAAGVATRPGAYNVTARTALNSSALTFSHEVGHNLGLRHAWGDSGNASSNPTNVDNYGWRFRTPAGTKLRTIMAYNSGWSGSRILHFSNPEITYSRAFTGAVSGFDATDTSSSPAYDQQLVEEGIIGVLGAGFDGSNSQLGARNGPYLRNNTQTMVNRRTRESLAVLDPQTGLLAPTGSNLTIFWYGGDHTDSIALALYKGGIFQSTIASGISGEDRWYDWTVPNVTDGNDYSIRVTLNGSTFDNSGNFTIGKVVESLPYREDFEEGSGSWVTSAGSDFAWTRQTGGTSTEAAGPEGASEGDYYFYSEGHGASEPYQLSSIEANFDFTGVSEIELAFDYHMYGLYIDYLALDVNDGSGWDLDVWIQDGQQHSSSSDPWSEAAVNLSAYAGNSEVTLRFRTANLLWYAADPSLDRIRISEPVGPLVAHWSLDDTAGSTASDSVNGFDGTQANATWVDGIVGGALDFNSSTSTVSLPTTAFQSIEDEVTFSIWIYGDGNQPQSDTLLHATDSAGNRVLNIHLPWGDSKVYWDAGFENGYDRISKAATSDQFLNQWNHWVFTKNVLSGEMAIYHNGILWHSGSGFSRAMGEINNVVLGSQIGKQYYSGVIDEVRLYNVSLDAQEVSDLFLSYTTSQGVPFAWLMNNGLEPSEASAMTDTDGDGQSNSSEWFFGTNPLNIDSPVGPLSAENDEISFDYTRRKLDGVTIAAEWSPDLTDLSWKTMGLNEVVMSDDGEVETVSVSAAQDEARKFLRIKVEQE
ncbi:MAG: LamG-like jellyroll fold domain-containing protein [Roseibacillus sp.]